MNRKTCHLIALAALLFAGAASTACSTSSDNEIIDQTPAQPTNGKYTLTVNATKVADATTRALTLDGNTLNATWTEDDKVTVLKYMSNPMTYESSWDVVGQLTVGNVRDGGLTCSLIGEFQENSLELGDYLRLVYPGKNLTPGQDQSTYFMNYAGQDGLLSNIAKKYDYCSTSDQLSKAVKVTAVNGTNITTSDATFTSNQAIVRFTLLDKNNNKFLSKTLDISAKNSHGQEQIVVSEQITGINTAMTLSKGTLEISNIAEYDFYVAVRGFTDMNITLTAVKDNNKLTYTKSNVTFEDGKYYEITVKMKN